MTTIWNWDSALKAFQSMYEGYKDADREYHRHFAAQGLGMLELIPQIRDFDVLQDAEVNISIGQFVITSKSAALTVRLACDSTFRYVVFIYYNQSTQAQTYEFDRKQIAGAIYDLFSAGLNAKSSVSTE